MIDRIKAQLNEELAQIRKDNRYKTERVIESAQGPEIVVNGKRLLNFCSNNYLGLANDPRVVDGAKDALARWGYGLSSVRFICGTLSIHKILEKKTAEFLGTDDAILYSSCFDANAGLFETIATEGDCIVSDKLNHASIIDGVRLCKAERKVFAHADMDDLAKVLEECKAFRRVIVVTDGVFSMDGDIANLATICSLAERHGALVVVDDSHATGVIGTTGKGSHEYNNVMGRVDVITGTYGKALGGASGGFAAGRKEIVELLRQRSRPYLFSNSVPPVVAATSASIIDMLQHSPNARQTLNDNAAYFRSRMTKLGFDVRPGQHPIVPIMLYDEGVALRMADALLNEGIYVISFSYPVVPVGQARIRVQLSAAHHKKHLDAAIKAFEKVGKNLNVIK